MGISGIGSRFAAENNGVDRHPGSGVNINIAGGDCGLAAACDGENAACDIEIHILLNVSFTCAVNGSDSRTVNKSSHTVFDFKVNFLVAQRCTVVEGQQFCGGILPDAGEIHRLRKFINVQGGFAAFLISVEAVVEGAVFVLNDPFFAVDKGVQSDIIDYKFRCFNFAVSQSVDAGLRGFLKVEVHGDGVRTCCICPSGKEGLFIIGTQIKFKSNTVKTGFLFQHKRACDRKSPGKSEVFTVDSKRASLIDEKVAQGIVKQFKSALRGVS